MYRNKEGYTSPTEFEALSRIRREENKEKRKNKYKPLVYICSPYAGDTNHNIENARKYSRYAVDSACIPITPHIYFTQFMDDCDPKERKTALFMNSVLLSKCDELWVFGDTYSDGMKREIKWAKHRKIHIRYMKGELI